MLEPRLSLFVLLGLFACESPPTAIAEAHADERPGGGGSGVAVVELFTSEGCSSCPPADDVLARLAATGGERVFALSFHVDYWDDLGWPDRFASPAFTSRQQAYARALGTKGLYTPQMVMNGTEEFIGSDAKRADAALGRALARASEVQVDVRPRWTSPGQATVDYSVSSAPSGSSLVVVVIERQDVTSVLRGENAGKTLRHANVVRALASSPLEAATGSMAVTVPSSLARPGAQLVGWVQTGVSPNGMRILGASRVPLPAP